MTLRKIISGGQTGADQGALAAARELGLETGGWMPLGFRTERGLEPELAQRYGLHEYVSPTYPPRTELNVILADATLIFGDVQSGGSRLTRSLCLRHDKPFHIVSWAPDRIWLRLKAQIDEFRAWLNLQVSPETLNVAGNRESRAPGIHDACRDFLVEALNERMPSHAR